MRIKGEVVHKGYIVPVEVEICVGFFGVNEVLIHIPIEYRGTSDLLHMVEFKSDLDEEIRPYNSMKAGES